MAPVCYREMRDEDRVFVVKSWVSSFQSAHAAGVLSITPFGVPCRNCGVGVPYDFASVMTHTIEAILRRPGCRTWVAYSPGATPPSDLHGWVSVESGANLPSYRPPTFALSVTTADDPLVHYCFVKRAFRNFGIARALLKAAGVDPEKPLLYSCKTADVSSLEKAGKLPRARWSPLSVRFEKTNKGKS